MIFPPNIKKDITEEWALVSEREKIVSSLKQKKKEHYFIPPETKDTDREEMTARAFLICLKE